MAAAAASAAGVYGGGGSDIYESRWGASSFNSHGDRKKQVSTVEQLFGKVNYDLLVSKTYYFFFFAAFGSLFPLLGVYFKQLGMNASQAGMLIGIRTFIEFVSAPFWGSLADRWKKGKQLLLFSLFCWVAFTLGMGFVQPKAHSCIRLNHTKLVLIEPWATDVGGELSTPGRGRRDVSHMSKRSHLHQDLPAMDRYRKISKRSWFTGDLSDLEDPPIQLSGYGFSPAYLTPQEIANSDQVKVKGLVSPVFTNVVYRSKDVYSAFLLILLLMILGEFLSAPALTLADAATLGYLKEDMERYGHQRMFGSLGWAVSMFFVGIALDHSNIFPDHPCGHSQVGEKNYMTCYAVFSVLMSCAFLTATQFRFSFDGFKDTIQLSQFKDKVIDKVSQAVTKRGKYDREQLVEEDDDFTKTSKGEFGRPAEEYMNPSQQAPGGAKDPWGASQGYAATNDPWGASNGAVTQDGMKRSSSQEKKIQISLTGDGPGVAGTVAEAATETAGPINSHSPYIPRGHPGQAGTMPEWVSVLRIFANLHYGALLYVTWFIGFGLGLIFTFLFWHLQDMHGTPTLFGISSVVTHISEIIVSFFSRKLIFAVGHIRVLYIGLLANVARFLYISWIRNPWLVIPFEFIAGLAHASVWAAACSYITQACPMHLRPTAQLMLQGLFHSLGRGCGAVFGGVLVYYFGTEYTFRGYGFACLVVVIGYFALNWFTQDRYGAGLDGSEPHQMLEETSTIAPCGVPMNPMTRNLSSSKLDESQDATGGYGATSNQTNGFLNPGNTGGYYQQDSGFSSGGDNQGQGYYGQGGYGGGGSGGGGGGGYGYHMNGYHKQKDHDVMRHNFQTYSEVINQNLTQKPSTRALVMGQAPVPHTEMFLQQPDNTVADLSEGEEGVWY